MLKMANNLLFPRVLGTPLGVDTASIQRPPDPTHAYCVRRNRYVSTTYTILSTVPTYLLVERYELCLYIVLCIKEQQPDVFCLSWPLRTRPRMLRKICQFSPASCSRDALVGDVGGLGGLACREIATTEALGVMFTDYIVRPLEYKYKFTVLVMYTVSYSWYYVHST